MPDQAIPEGATAAQYQLKRWGVRTIALPTVISNITPSTPTRVLLNNPRRMEWMIWNPTSANLYLDWGPSVGSSSMLIPPLGGSMVCLVDEDGELVTYEVWVLNQGTSQQIGVREIQRV